MPEPRIFFPVALNFANWPCTIVGGGEEAEFKTRIFNQFGKTPTVIAESFTPGLQAIAESGGANLVRRAYSPELLDGARVVLACSDNEQLNLTVGKDARARGMLFNMVDNAEVSDFIASSFVRRGNITVNVMTDALSPAFANSVRNRSPECWRPVIRAISSSSSKRKSASTASPTTCASRRKSGGSWSRSAFWRSSRPKAGTRRRQSRPGARAPLRPSPLIRRTEANAIIATHLIPARLFGRSIRHSGESRNPEARRQWSICRRMSASRPCTPCFGIDSKDRYCAIHRGISTIPIEQG